MYVMLYSTVQCSSVQYGTVQYTVQLSHTGGPTGHCAHGVLELPRGPEARLPPVRGPRGPSDRGLEVDVGVRGQQLGCGGLVRLQPHAGLQRRLRAQQDQE